MCTPLIALALDSKTVVEPVDSVELSLLEKSQLMLDLSQELNVNLVVEDYIRLTAKTNNVNVCYALDIAYSESGFVASAKNKTSTAGGVYQFLDGTWKNYATELWGVNHTKSKLNYKDNVDLAIYVFKTYGTKDWNASKYTGHAWANQPYTKGNC